MNTPKEIAERASLRWIAAVGTSGVQKEPKPEERGRYGGRVPELGETRSFVPAAFTDWTTERALPSLRDRGLTVTGTVVLVNEAHRWCRVEYELGCEKHFECFKF